MLLIGAVLIQYSKLHQIQARNAPDWTGCTKIDADYNGGCHWGVAALLH
jgi:hypothetical protein